MSDVFVHGVGLLTALGAGVPANWRALRQGKELTDRGVIPTASGEPTWDRVVMLAASAMDMALHDANWPPEVYGAAETGLFVATSKGPVLTWLRALGTIRNSSAGALDENTARHVALGPGLIAAALGDRFELTGARHTSVAACAGGLLAVHQAVAALRRGDCCRAIVVAADASADPFFENSFDNLGVLAHPDADGHRRCRPFDPRGAGFFISEAAAAVVLSLAPPLSVAADSTATIERTWRGADATHLVAADKAATALRRGLTQLSAGQPVAFVHAHATGTRFDGAEYKAIRTVCGTQAAVFSHKRWLGHSLGASGLVALVLSLACHRHRETLAGGRLSDAGGVVRSITIAQGFGGAIAMVCCRG